MSLAEWGNAGVIISIICLLTFPVIFYFHRKDPLISIREPYICITEMVLDLLLMLFVSSTVASPAIYDMWLKCPCVIQNCINAGLGAVIWNVCMARICLFYRLGQLGTEDGFENTIADKVVTVMGYLNGPALFTRLERRVHASGDSVDGDDKKSIRSAVTGETGTSKSSEKRQQYMERLVWGAKIFIWLLFWALLSILVTYPVDGDLIFELMETAFPACSVTIFYPIGYQLIFWNALQLAIILQKYKSVDDAFGLRNELLIGQTIFSLFWTVDGLMMVISPDAYFSYGVYADVTAMFTHACLTFGYPIALVYWRRYKQGAQSPNQRLIHTVDDFEKYYRAEEGRLRVRACLERRYAIENALFLDATANISKMDATVLKNILRKFILRDSTYEVNLPNNLRKNFKFHVEDIAKSGEGPAQKLLAECRKHIAEIVIGNLALDHSYDF